MGETSGFGGVVVAIAILSIVAPLAYGAFVALLLRRSDADAAGIVEVLSDLARFDRRSS